MMKLSDQKRRLEAALSELHSLVAVYVEFGDPSVLVVSVEDEDEMHEATQLAAMAGILAPVEVELHQPRAAVALNVAG